MQLTPRFSFCIALDIMLTSTYSGDSYTTIKFDINSSQRPSLPLTPLGLPYPGLGSPNGPSWSAYLTYHFNYSATLTYNVAFGGATVDRYIVTPFLDLIWTFREQVTKWLLKLGNHPNTAPWTGSNSLFFFWFGINDLWRSSGK